MFRVPIEVVENLHQFSKENRVQQQSLGSHQKPLKAGRSSDRTIVPSPLDSTITEAEFDTSRRFSPDMYPDISGF
ncbi:MAG: hypothetical protein CM15mP68_3780 [Pseudomonadota bacterium]|nr:MAG: hypothetical protein CM15mP68_3780 [Pseudomonadota bacterium]